MHWKIFHNASFCNSNVHTCSCFCYKMVHCGICDWRIVGFVQHVYSELMYGRNRCPDSHSSLQWRHNGRDSVSNHQPQECLLNSLFRRRSNKTSKLRVTGVCAGNSPGTGEFPAQMASNAEDVSIWWRHHVCGVFRAMFLSWWTSLKRKLRQFDEIFISGSTGNSYIDNDKCSMLRKFRQSNISIFVVQGRGLSLWWRHQMETFSALLAICAGNSRAPVNSSHKGRWRGALMFSLICVWINDWVNNREAGDLRRHRGHSRRHHNDGNLSWPWTYYEQIIMSRIPVMNSVSS